MIPPALDPVTLRTAAKAIFGFEILPAPFQAVLKHVPMVGQVEAGLGADRLAIPGGIQINTAALAQLVAVSVGQLVMGVAEDEAAQGQVNLSQVEHCPTISIFLAALG